MRAYLYHRWHAARLVWERACEDVRHETRQLPPRRRPDLYVNLSIGRTRRLNHYRAVKYIALLALVKIVPTHPYLVAEYQDVIMSSINDQDISIRMRALDLVSAMVRLIRGISSLSC